MITSTWKELCPVWCQPTKETSASIFLYLCFAVNCQHAFTVCTHKPLFRRVLISREARLLHLSYLSLRLSVRMLIAAPTGRMIVQFNTGEAFTQIYWENLILVKIFQK